MYTLSQIRRQVDALKRKFATELTILRLRPLAEEYCLLWSEAITDGNSPPDSYAFIRHIARQGFRLNTFTSLHLYLERCRENHRNPNTIGIVAALLPEMRPDRLEELLLDDSSDEESPSGGPLAGGASPVPVASWIPSWLWNAHAVARLLAPSINRHSGETRYPEVPATVNLHNPGMAHSATGLHRKVRRHFFPHCHPHPTNAKLPPYPLREPSCPFVDDSP